MKNLLSSNVKHNFNIGSIVTVTSDRDDYEDKSMEAEMLKHEGKKLTIDEIYVIDKELVHYYCIDENGVSPMMPGEVRLAFIDADLIAYQSPLLTAGITGLPELFDIKDNFLTFVGEWMNGKECRTGENRTNGTVTYNEDGLYFYEFKTREDAFKYFFEDDRSVPYAIAEYDEEASEENEEETLGDWEFYNGFNSLCLNPELEEFMQKNILSEEEKDELVAEIYSWHENCEHGQNGECKIFNAINRYASDDEVILIAFDIDRDLFDKFEKELN